MLSPFYVTVNIFFEFANLFMTKNNYTSSKSKHKKLLRNLRIKKLEEKMKLNIKKRKTNNKK